MTKNTDKNDYKELSKNEIFKKISEEIIPIQENLSEKKITIENAINKIKKIREEVERLDSSNLEEKEKNEIWKLFDRLEEKIEENNLQNENNEIINSLKVLTQKHLTNLKSNIKQEKNKWVKNRPLDVQKWINERSNKFTNDFKYAAKTEKNWIANKAANIIVKLTETENLT